AEQRPGHLPVTPVAVGGEEEGALAGPDQDPDAAHRDTPAWSLVARWIGACTVVSSREGRESWVAASGGWTRPGAGTHRSRPRPRALRSDPGTGMARAEVVRGDDAAAGGRRGSAGGRHDPVAAGRLSDAAGPADPVPGRG